LPTTPFILLPTIYVQYNPMSDTSPCALIALTLLPYSPAMIHSFSRGGSLLGHAAAIRLHVAREDWLPTGLGLPGCAAKITVIKHKLAPPDGQARVRIHFDAQGRL